MGSPSGHELKLAAKLASVWGTSVACGANSGILMLPGSLKLSRDSNIDDSLGLFWPTDSDPGEIKAEGERNFYMRYDTLDLLIALFMGTAGAPTYTSGVATNGTGDATTGTLLKTGAGWSIDEHAGKFWKCTADTDHPTNVGQVRRITSNTADTLTFDAVLPYHTNATTVGSMSAGIAEHTYDLADSIDGLFATLALNKKINIEEACTAKIMSMTIKGSVGKPLEISFKILANTISFSSVTNTTTTFNNVTYRDQANRVLFNQGIIRLNAQNGADFADGDKVWPSEFELTIERKMAGVYGAGGTFDTIDEPTNDGIPEAKLKLTFPRHTATTYFTEWAANTAKKMDLVFTGGLISGATSRKLTIQIPNMKYASTEAPEDRGIIKNNLEFNLLAAAAAPTGMSGVTKPVRLKLVNAYCGDPLQAGN